MATLKNLSVTSWFAVFIALGTVDAVQASTFYGEAQPLGNGSTRTFVELDNNGNPSEIGVKLTQGALSLPTTPPDIKLNLSLPPEASATPFKFSEVTYRPVNYPGVPDPFEVPRFSTDFFLISPQERDLICPNPDTTGPLPLCVGDEAAQVLKTPPPGTLPEGLVPAGFPEASHGIRYFEEVRFFDPNNPSTTYGYPYIPSEINGQPPQLAWTYDYAVADGKITSLDVVVSKPFLETHTNVTVPIKTPPIPPVSGYYPTGYSITYDPDTQEYTSKFVGLKYLSSTRVPEPSSTLGIFALSAFGVVFLLKRKKKQTAQIGNLN